MFFCVVALATAVVLAKGFGLNRGYSAGLVGGGLTQSSVIGTADSAIQYLTAGKATSNMDLKSDVAVAYAVTYVFGDAGLIILLKIIPHVWRVNLPEAAKQAEAELGSTREAESVEAFHWSNLVFPRAFRVENEAVVGKTVQEVEALFPEHVAIDMLKKGDEVIDQVSRDAKLDTGDAVVLIGFPSQMCQIGTTIGPEVDDKALQEMVGEILGICVTNKALDGKTVQEIFATHGHGCFVRRIIRQAHDLPLVPNR